MKSRNRGRQARGARLVLRCVHDGAEVVLEAWEAQRLLRLLSTDLQDALSVGTTAHDGAPVAAELGSAHPLHAFFVSSAQQGGYIVERA